MISLLISFSLQAQVFKVKKMKGKAIYKNKKWIKTGDKLIAPGIIKTGTKSFVMLVSKQGKLTIGPKSSLYITKSRPQNPTLLQVIKGKIRGHIKKSNNDKYKMYIKTRSASIGIRGTDFLVVYNNKNHITSNLTINGEVDFYKKSDKQILSSLKEDLDKDSHYLNYDEEEQELRDELEHYNAVQVKKGTFSGAYPTYVSPLSPTRISKKQITILRNDATLGAVKQSGKTHKNKANRRFKITNRNLIPEPIKKVDKKVLMSNKEKSISEHDVRHGGILDTNTGIYIMPPEGANYNKQDQAYEVPEEYGGIDHKTGEYVPPKNIELDPLQGFVQVIDGKKKQIDTFTKSIGKLFDKYKEITRVDLDADARYFYSLKSYEDYYGEITNVSEAESMIFDFEGNIGRHLFNNKRYLHYIKAGLELIYHSRQREPKVQRNDRLISHYGYEFHRKHNLFRRKARFIIDLDFETIYQDFRAREKWDFYTESVNLSIFERFKTSRYHQLELGATISGYQGHANNNHGNIYEYFIKNKILPNIPWEAELNYFFRVRRSKLDGNRFDISNYSFMLRKLEILRKTNLSYYANLFFSRSKKKITYDKGLVYSHKLEVTRRKGEHFKFNAFYNYMRNKAEGIGANQNFIQQLWGVGLKFIF